MRPAFLEIAPRAVSAVIRGHDQLPKVLVTNTAARTTAEVSVGVTGERSATAVCRDLHDSIAAELIRARAVPPLNITVKISSIAFAAPHKSVESAADSRSVSGQP